MTIHQKCGTEWTGAAIQHCAACCETFTGTRPGDIHRVPIGEDGRSRCLTPEEMLALKHPLIRDWRGFWTSGSGERRDNLAAARARRARQLSVPGGTPESSDSAGPA